MTALAFDDSDLLSRLHTLRSYALDVKKQAEDMHLFLIAVRCATVAEEATAAIDMHNSKTFAAHVPTSRAG